MRVLVAFESGSYRLYSDAIAELIRELRPHVEVVTLEPEELETRGTHLDPDLVICGRPCAPTLGSRPAWLEYSLSPDQPSAICLDGQYSESNNPELKDLLSIIDKTERLAQTGRDLGDC